MVIRSLRARVAAMVGVVTFLLLIGTGVAYASWTATQQSTSGSATSANLDLTVAGDLSGQYAFSGTGTGNPAGSVITKVVTITNPLTSTVSLNSNFTLTATATGGTLAGSEVNTWIYAKPVGACVAPTTGGATLASAQSYTAPTGGTIAPGASVSVCLSTRLNNTVALHTGKSIIITLTATDGYSTTSWAAAAPAVASTQTVFTVTKPVVTCTDETGGDYGLSLTWTMQPGVTYDVLKNTSTTPVKTGAVSGDVFTVQSGNNVGTGATSLTVRGTAYGVVVSSNAIPIKYETVLFIFSTIRCNPQGTY
jgi:hypothetical protein